jgi:hypothetical protein
MIDSTPRGQEFLKEHGKLPSEMAGGTEGDPGNVAPMVAYLATDDAAHINGHFFGVRGTTIQLYSHWEMAGVLQAERTWTPEELIRLFPETLGKTIDLPEPVTLPGSERPVRGTTVMQADPATWSQLAPGVDVWARSTYFDAKQ